MASIAGEIYAYGFDEEIIRRASHCMKFLKDILVPNPHNGFVPVLLRPSFIIAVLLSIAGAEFAFNLPSIALYANPSFFAAVVPDELIKLTNENRVSFHIEPLRENALLKEAATLKANDMASKEYFSHDTPDGKTPWHWLEKVGYQFSYAGENLAVNFFESQDVAQAWIQSQNHKKNILNEHFTEIGVAMAEGTFEGKNAVYVVQFLASPSTGGRATAQTAKPDRASSLVLDAPLAIGTTENAKTILPATIARETPRTPLSYKTVIDLFYGLVVALALLALMFAVLSRGRFQRPVLVMRCMLVLSVVSSLLVMHR